MHIFNLLMITKYEEGKINKLLKQLSIFFKMSLYSNMVTGKN